MFKRTKLKAWLTACCLILAFWGNAQTGNPVWSLPSNYSPFNPNLGTPIFLPNGTASNQYPNTKNPNNQFPVPFPYDNSMMQNQDTAGPSNMMADAGGNPLFFVNNGYVFNNHGYLIDILADTATGIGGFYAIGSAVYSYPDASGNNKQIAEGWGEVCVVPRPGSCTQYYIFTAADASMIYYRSCWINSNGGVGSAGANTYGYKPFYALVDMGQQTPGAPTGEFGKNITSTLGLAGGGQLADLYVSTNTQSSISGDLCSPFLGSIKYACTKLIGGSYRFLFVMNDYEVVVYKITSSNITFIQNVSLQEFPRPSRATIFNGNTFDMGELECYVDSTNNRIKLAIEGTDASSLAFANFSMSTGQIDTTSFANVSTGSNINGLEFSPNGNYVYIVGNGVTATTYSAPTTFTTITTSTDFNASQIELGKDGNLYLIGQNGSGTPYLAKISSPNSPTPGTPATVMSLPSYSLTTKNMVYYGFNGSGPFTNTTYAFYLPDQIDQEVYGGQFDLGHASACCLINEPYDQQTYYAGTTTATYTNTSSTQTWSVNTTGHYNNPLTTSTSSTVTIGEELRIPAGKTITIQNMTIKFSPQARLIIENGTPSKNGGHLTLSNCTLTVDNRCGYNDMWPGVQVWGSYGQAQTTTAQGLLQLQNGTIIENAYIGVLAGYSGGTWLSSVTPAPSPLWPDTTVTSGLYNLYSSNPYPGGGGLINSNATSSSSGPNFTNNQRGIVYNNYSQSPGSYQLLQNAHFIVNSALLNSSVHPTSFVAMYNHNKVSMKGCTFNDTYNANADTGIFSVNSAYTVDAYSTTQSVFSNLNYGIYSFNNTGSATISCKNSMFNNNYFGIYLGNINNAIVETDTFKIWLSTCSGHCNRPSTYGLYLDVGTGYSVRDNYFTKYGTSTPTNSLYGIIANNSPNVNFIFRNTFNYLAVGNQAQFQNYIYSTLTGYPHNLTGLQYICNVFTTNNISKKDIYVPGNNNGDTITYIGTSHPHLAGIANQQGANSGTFDPVAGNSFSHTSGGTDFYIDTLTAYSCNYVYYCTGGPTCPTSPYYPLHCRNTSIGYYATNTSCSTINTYTCSGCRTTQSDPLQSMQDLADAYKVTYDSLLALAKHGHTKNTLGLAKNMSDAFSVRHLLLDDLIRTYLRDTVEENMQKGYALMKIKALELPARNQVEIGLNINDTIMATNALAQVANEEGQSNYVKLHAMLLQNIGKTAEQIMSDKSAVSVLQAMATDSSDRLTYLKVHNLLRIKGLSKYIPYIIPDETGNSDNNERKAQLITVVKSESSLINSPNPFKESTTVKAVVVEKTQNAFIVITDMVGNEVARYAVQQGENNINVNAGSLNQSVMFCTLVVDGIKIKTNKMVLIK